GLSRDSRISGGGRGTGRGARPTRLRAPTRTPMPPATHTIRLHRVLHAPPERVYRAFIDPAAMCKWLPPHGFTGTVHSMDARVGGGYRMSFTNFANGGSHSFGGTFVEMVPGERLRYTDKFEDPNLPGEMS